jgi:hypothetical protein
MFWVWPLKANTWIGPGERACAQVGSGRAKYRLRTGGKKVTSSPSTSADRENRMTGDDPRATRAWDTETRPGRSPNVAEHACRRLPGHFHAAPTNEAGVSLLPSSSRPRPSGPLRTRRLQTVR